MGVKKCIICGSNLILTNDLHYVSRDEEEVVSGLKALTGTQSFEPKIYDSFDCPVCGCQNNMQERKRSFYVESCNLEFTEDQEVIEVMECNYDN